MRAIKRRWTEAEYAALVEFTTGYGPRSGGKRRPHWNLLLKGIPAADLDELREVVTRVWCSRVDAAPAGQFVGTVSEAGGLMRYLALHFQKDSQRPPDGWRGHRFMHSHGYFAEGTAAIRERAREQLQFRREVWKIEQAASAQGVELYADEIDELATEFMERRAATSWELVRLYELATAPRADVVRASIPTLAPAKQSAGPERASLRESTSGPGRSPRPVQGERQPPAARLTDTDRERVRGAQRPAAPRRAEHRGRTTAPPPSPP